MKKLGSMIEIIGPTPETEEKIARKLEEMMARKLKGAADKAPGKTDPPQS